MPYARLVPPLHASRPWYQVCSEFEPNPPHFLNHAPPSAQQLSSSEFSLKAHLGHLLVDMILVVVSREVAVLSESVAVVVTVVLVLLVVTAGTGTEISVIKSMIWTACWALINDADSNIHYK